MGARTTPDPQRAADARFNQLQVERFRSDSALAVGHSNSRNARVVEVLCHLSLLRSVGAVRADATVTCVAAERQHFSSPEGYQAAHYLPGQIQLNGRLPWAFLHNASSRLDFECLFADVEHLPANFNKADSAAEAHGLKDAFGVVCQAILRDPKPKPGHKIDRDLVRRIYRQTWCKLAAAAFRSALGQKDARPHLVPLQRDAEGNLLNLAQREGASHAQWNIEEQLNILRHYLGTLETWPVTLQDYRMNELEQGFRP